MADEVNPAPLAAKVKTTPLAVELKPTATPKVKVIAATGGAAIGSAFSVVLIWLLTLALKKFDLSFPDNVTAALNTIFTTIATLAAGYYTPPGVNEGAVVDETTGSVRSATLR